MPLAPLILHMNSGEAPPPPQPPSGGALYLVQRLARARAQEKARAEEDELVVLLQSEDAA